MTLDFRSLADDEVRSVLQLKLAEVRWSEEEDFANAVAAANDSRILELLLTIVQNEWLFQSSAIYDKAIRVLGHVGGEEAVATLLRLASINDSHPVRLQAEEALRIILDPSSVDQLIEALTTNIPLSAKAKVVYALGRIRNPKAILVLLDLLKSDVSELTKEAVNALGTLKVPAAVPILIASLDKFYIAHPFETARTLRRVNSPETPALLLAQMQNVTWEQKAAVIRVISELRLNQLVPEIIPCLYDSSDYVRQVAARAFWRLDAAAEAKQPLLHLLQEDPIDLVRAEAALALQNYPDPYTVEALMRALDDSFPRVRQYAIHALAFLVTTEASYKLLQLAREDPDKSTRVAAIRALGVMRITEAVPVLNSLLNTKSDFQVAEALGLIGTDEAVETLLSALNQTEDRIKKAKILQALGESVNRLAKPSIIEAFNDQNPWVRGAVIYSLRNFPDTDTLQILLKALEDPDPAVRFGAVRRLRERDDSTVAIPKLIAVMQSNEQYLGAWRYEAVPIELPLSMAAALTLKTFDHPVAQTALAEWLQDHSLPDFSQFAEDE